MGDTVLLNNLLIIGSDAQGSLESAYFRALKKLGVKNVKMFDVTAGRVELGGSQILHRGLNRYLLSPFSRHLVSERLVSFLASDTSNFEAVIVFKGAEFSRNLLEKCRQILRTATWVNINPDDPLNISSRGSTNGNIVESISFYDLYCIWSKRLIDKLADQGCRRVEYLPFGYDSDFHIPPSEELKLELDAVSFVGAWDREREAVLTSISDYRLRVFGNGWDRISKSSPLRPTIVPRNIYRAELAKVIASSAVSLNLPRPQNIGSHNMRTFEIPAMGGLMLTARTDEQQLFFPEDEACLMYSGIEELRKKLDLAIKDSDLAQRIRCHGIEQVHQHSYVERARLLLDMLSDVIGKTGRKL